MVTVKALKQKGNTYYYLQHTFRHKGKVSKKEKYLGKKIPKNIDQLKQQFAYEIYAEKWFGTFDEIKKNYKKEQAQLPRSIQEKEMETFAVRFTYDTNRIEGSSLTYRETANLLEHGITPKEKPIKDVKEAESHRDVFIEMLDYEKDLTLRIVLQWHKNLLAQTKADVAGQLRNYQVAISGSKFMPPSPVEVQLLMLEFFKWYEKNKNKIHPVELAALVHLKFVTIHPFGDGNGRISRLLMNFVLNKCGFPMLDIQYTNRSSYYNALERAQVKRNDSIFLNWFYRKYTSENKKYTKSLKK